MPVGVSLPKKGMIYQRQQYSKSRLARWYWNYKDEKELDALKDCKTVLELGCGEGITLEKALKIFSTREIWGTDLENENIEICCRYKLPVIQNDILRLCFKECSVHGILLAEVIEHITEYKQALKEIWRILKPEGILVIVFPNDVFFKFARILTLKFREAFYDPGHVKKWNPDEMENFLREEGFSIVRKENTPFYFWTISLHCLIVAKKDLKL